jgi:hypothetical protein
MQVTITCICSCIFTNILPNLRLLPASATLGKDISLKATPGGGQTQSIMTKHFGLKAAILLWAAS